MSAVHGSLVPTGDDFRKGLARRTLRGSIWGRFYSLSLVIAILALIALFLNIVNSAFGYVVSVNEVEPTTLVEGGDLGALDSTGLVAILQEYEERRLPVYIRDNLSAVDPSVFTQVPIRESLAGHSYPADLGDSVITDLSRDQQAAILAENVSAELLRNIVETDVVSEQILHPYTLSESLFERARIDAEFAEDQAENPTARLYFRSWLTLDSLSSPGSSDPAVSGVRTALLGTLWVIAITVLFAFPVGVGAAIYLEEYATASRFNKLIETNIRNLAGVPSIIYGLLGLAILVRTLEFATQGRTILSAGLTLGLLILPVIIINSQEALRSVPSSIREASYGVGATKWQTIWNQVLPAAMPGILTGTILAMSRAVGETAPLIVIGASTFIVSDPSNPFAKFTALPIQIYQWTARPQSEFRAIAAAAILVLLALLLILNATAIILRQRYRKSLQG
ncbi:MAG: phosphate ABC transporter permease PstA [Chloroflexi bacterium]|nr:phosphate ABC transporter permease PstA [Chloroflexota bacterium]